MFVKCGLPPGPASSSRSAARCRRCPACRACPPPNISASIPTDWCRAFPDAGGFLMLFGPAECTRLVVKIGSALLVEDAGEVRRDWLAKLAAEIGDRQRAGQRIVVVSSGSIALGARRLGMAKCVRSSLEDSQSAAATGQIELSRVWAEVLGEEGLTSAQILVTPAD